MCVCVCVCSIGQQVTERIFDESGQVLAAETLGLVLVERRDLAAGGQFAVGGVVAHTHGRRLCRRRRRDKRRPRRVAYVYTNIQLSVQPRPSPVYMTLPAFVAERRAAATMLMGAGARRCRSLSPARTALSSKPPHAAAAAIDGIDRQTDGRTPDRFRDPALQAVSISKQLSK